ncbi:MAG: 5-(carboxyamino)imidazole ribonucleotide synthase [Ignavibacteria bacterium]|nr:5-(carboxyamino)imidazole ribonucleotide synthase [Ignavibacteria bacterium]
MKRKCIGILGGGQLARMSAYAAYRLGFDVAILEKEKNSPAGQITHKEILGWVNDAAILRSFAKQCDVITLENEFIDYQHLAFLEKIKKKVIPSSRTISLIQDKFLQKESLSLKNLPIADYLSVSAPSQFEQISKKFGVPFVLKSRKHGYDGYGNAFIKTKKDFEQEYRRLSSRHSKLLTEKFIDFRMELAVMVVRTTNEIRAYPVVQTIQKNHICHMVIAPAQINPKFKLRAKEIAIESVKAVGGFGIFGIEMFLTKEDKILINEIAPRPHNSGHYTIEGCVTSQFENHIRSILDLPLGSTEMVKPYAVMINLLGKKIGDGIVENYKTPLSNENAHLHIYGKLKSRIGRKMGHITLIGNELNYLIDTAKKIEKRILI